MARLRAALCAAVALALLTLALVLFLAPPALSLQGAHYDIAALATRRPSRLPTA